MDFNLNRLEKFENEKRIILKCLSAADLNKKRFGQLYCIFVNPGAVVGNHYHKKKEEYLVIVKGKLNIVLEDVKSKERSEMISDAAIPTMVHIMPNMAHAVENISDEPAILLEYSTEPFVQGCEDKEFYALL